MTALLVIAILFFLILVHELGHFVAAKLLGLQVEEFGIGYPPRALYLGKVGGTEYTLNWIPFGGFVRIFGYDTSDSLIKSTTYRRFSDASKSAQVIVLAAGVFMNVIAAWALLTGALTLGVPQYVAEKTEGVPTQLIISHVLPHSPAEVAGLQSGDVLLKLEALGEHTESDITPQDVAAFVETRGGKSVTVSYQRGEAIGEVVVRPAHAVLSDQSGRVAIGVELALVTNEALPLPAAMKASVYKTADMFQAVGRGLGSVVSGILEGDRSWEELVGPIGLVDAVSQATEFGTGYVLALAAFISVNLAVINLIPIPALDGGRLAVLAYEMFTRTRISHLAMSVLNMVGVAMVALLIIMVTYQDIARLLA